jgi:hypothetical protein
VRVRKTSQSPPGTRGGPGSGGFHHGDAVWGGPPQNGPLRPPLVLYKLSGFCRADLGGRDQKSQADMPWAFLAKTVKNPQKPPKNGQKPPVSTSKNTKYGVFSHFFVIQKRGVIFRPPRPHPETVVGRPGDTHRVSESRRWGARECTGTKKNKYFFALAFELARETK